MNGKEKAEVVITDKNFKSNNFEFNSNKQIEEMEQDLIDSVEHETLFDVDFYETGKNLIAKGYRKICENQVILTQEEYEYLCACETDYRKQVVVTASDIFNGIEEIAYKNGEGDLFIDLADFAEFRKKYIGE